MAKREPADAELDKLMSDLAVIVDDLSEDISLEDVKRNPWLLKLVALSARVTDAARYPAYEWAKMHYPD